MSEIPIHKKVIIIGGPNGAGKTTFAYSFLPKEAQLLRFINADLIAAGLSPFAPRSVDFLAGRLMLQEINRATESGDSFAFETTLSGLNYLGRIRDWRQRGYRVSLYYLSLSSEEVAIARVAERVLQGGHHIPEAVIRRRFQAGLQNFKQYYQSAVSDWVMYDNSSSTPKLLAWGENQ